MIQQPHFPFEPWGLEETELDLALLPQTESLFALSNGHIGLRGNLDEGEPAGMPGTYLNAVHDLRPMPYAEGGYGYPQSGQTICNITNGKVMRLLVNDWPFDVRHGRLVQHKRRLDFRTGTLERTCEWTTPSGQTVRIHSRRMVSLVQRGVVVISYEVEAVDHPLRVVLQSELVANEPMPSGSSDPRNAHALEDAFLPEEHDCHGASAMLLHRTKHTDIRVAAFMDHETFGTGQLQSSCSSAPDFARFTTTDLLEPGQRLRVVKYLTYGWSRKRTVYALRSQVHAVLVAARATGFESLFADQKKFLADFWQRADVEIDGHVDLQQAIRFALFHLLQAGARAETRAIPAKGLTGTGYDGHSFWDTEIFVLPVLLHTMPKAVADALRWRRSILSYAEENARTLRLDGAAFPWRTIHGEECSGYWPASTAAFHINADIADACMRYMAATDDKLFEEEVAAPIVIQTARLFAKLGSFDRDGRFCIDGVTGPDEYSAIADNNIYTNLMAGRNLRGAAAICERQPERAKALEVTADERALWLRAAENVAMPFDEELGVHMQAERFTKHAPWPFETTPCDDYPLLLHFPYFDIYRKQVVKQADLVLAMHLVSSQFTDEQKAANFEYYERITVRDSSLSASTQAVMAAEVGHLDLAFDYLRETAFMDLHDLERNTSDGIHLASLGGIWNAVVGGFGGMRDCSGQLRFRPRLPTQIPRIRFRMVRLGRHLEVVLADGNASYRLLEGDALEIQHDGEALTVGKEPIVRPLGKGTSRPTPTQPPHRAPLARDTGPRDGESAPENDAKGDARSHPK